MERHCYPVIVVSYIQLLDMVVANSACDLPNSIIVAISLLVRIDDGASFLIVSVVYGLLRYIKNTLGSCCGIANGGFISLVGRWGRDVHCIVGVLGSLTARHDLVISCNRGGQVSQCCITEPQKGLEAACYVRLTMRVSQTNA